MKKYSKVTLPAGIIIVKRLTPSTRLATINDDDNRNGENCLKAIYGTSTKLEFAYDYNGRRFNKKVYAKSGGNWVLSRESLFVYDNFKQIAEFTVSGSAKTLAKSYAWQPEASGDFDVPLWQKVGGNVYTCVVDGNKNVRRLLNTACTEVANYDYDPFGGVTASGTASAGNPFRFSSEFLDEETGLVYYNYRYYSPTLGRWISRDSIEEQGGVNLYVIVGNSIVSNCDRLGQSWLSELWEYLWTGISTAFSPTGFGEAVGATEAVTSLMTDFGHYVARAKSLAGLLRNAGEDELALEYLLRINDCNTNRDMQCLICVMNELRRELDKRGINYDRFFLDI